MDAVEMDRQAEELYKLYKEKLEAEHQGKIVMLDVDQEDVAAIAETPKEASSKALRLRPGHRFFMRRIGESPAVAKIRWDEWLG